MGLLLLTAVIAGWEPGTTIRQECSGQSAESNFTVEETVTSDFKSCPGSPTEECLQTRVEFSYPDGTSSLSSNFYGKSTIEEGALVRNARVQNCPAERRLRVDVRNLDTGKPEALPACKLLTSRRRYNNQAGEAWELVEEETITADAPLGMALDASAVLTKLSDGTQTVNARCKLTAFRRGSH